jgi:hypothetical protein
MKQVTNEKQVTGVTWTIFLLLPYYDPVRMVVIDLMHNVCLVIAKEFIRLVTDKNMINDHETTAYEMGLSSQPQVYLGFV